MDSRSRNRSVVIRQLVDGQDDIGQPTTVWATLATVRANVKYLSGVETIKGGAETATARASIRIAYRTNVTTAMQVTLGATVFKITAVLPDEVNKMHTDIVCEVIV